MSSPAFHVAFPVTDIEATRRFYVESLGCKVGRSAARWIDFDLHGHQLSAHLVDGAVARSETNPVDGDNVPVRHFGLILEWNAWHAFAEELRRRGVRFLIEPHIRFKGKVGEQATMFVCDPSGNALEFKSFQDPTRVFAT